MPKMNPNLDNNDDNEFSTGFKEYSVEAKAELQEKRDELKKKAFAHYRWDDTLLKISRFLQGSGRNIQGFGKWLSSVGHYMARYTYEDYSVKMNSTEQSSPNTQPARPKRPVSPPNAIH